MKKLLALSSVLVMLMVPAMLMAATLYIEQDYQKDGMGKYIAGLGWAGVLNSQLEGSPISNGIACLDVKGVAYSNWSTTVNVYTLTADNVREFRFYNGNDSATLLNYQKAAWLLTQMYGHQSEAAGIQFAIWSIFHPEFDIFGYNAGLGPSATTWLNNVNAINIADYNFSSALVFKPTNATVQEFMNVPVPVPPTLWLLGSGLVGLIGLRRKFKR